MFIMPRKKTEEKTRQVYASIREDLYLAAKARAAELRMPMREFIEHALELTLNGNASPDARSAQSAWEDEYLRMQIQQPLGSPVELTKEEAETVVRATFGSNQTNGMSG